MSFNVTSQAKAVTGYILDFFKSFYWYYYLLLLPFLLLIIYYKLIDKNIIKLNVNLTFDRLKTSVICILLLLVLGFSYQLTICLNVFQNKLQTISNQELFKNISNPTLAIKQFGTTVYGILDIKSLFMNNEIEISTSNNEVQAHNVDSENDKKWLELIENEENFTYNYLNEYFINNSKTLKNSYTGSLEDKNLIVIMMESVNDIFINEELYPNFYRLLSNGYYFKNNYSPRNSCATGNNELSGMIGLYPIYYKCTANVYRNNLYPESIFNLFKEKGYKTSSMHDYSDKYYQRREIHKNVGSDKYYDADDLKLQYNTKDEEWASDEDFMKQVVKILNNYKNNERFLTWLTTVTSHQPYGESLYGDKYLYLFADSKYDEYDIKLKRYMSKLKVLDNGLGILLEGLEKQGKLDNTVIVLYGDHYPYGLANSILQKALPYDISEKYENERVPFVIWSNDIEATTYEQYTSYVNLLPTIANLFNLDYDSRYYVGSDLFSSEYQNLVVYTDGSWKNNICFYDASTSDIIYYTSKEYSTEEIIEINKDIGYKIKYSDLAIQHDYFNYLYQKLYEK